MIGTTATRSLCLLIGGLIALTTLATAQVAPPPAGWPKFWYKGVVTNKDVLNYPTHDNKEYIFPSVFHAGRYLENPLGEWYIYYAPHEDPGGISFMYADNIEGPWTEYVANPVIANVWSPHYSVPHVSSPDAAWNAEAGRLFMYFHGANSETRWAESDDGINFDYGGLAVDNSMGGPDVTETSYARVFPHPDTASSYNYAMFYMGNERDNIRRIRLAESTDGREWTVDPDYVVEPGSEEGANVSAADLWLWNGQLYVVYHASSGKSYARTIDSTLRNVGSQPILLHESSGNGDDTGRVASPLLVPLQDGTYLFYESGDRLGATIAWAKAE